MSLGQSSARLLRENRGFLAFLLLFGLFRTAVADWNPIPSGSMHPTLLEGDLVFVNRLAYDLKLPLTDRILVRLNDPQRGDVVTFSSPHDGTRLIQRLIAVPGDVVEMRSNRLFINGAAAQYQATSVEPRHDALDAPWPVQQQRESVAGRDYNIQWLDGADSRNNFTPVRLGNDQFLMLGDNRDNSVDSRYIGLVQRHLLIGRAVGIIGSLDTSDWWQPRVERFAKRLE